MSEKLTVGLDLDKNLIEANITKAISAAITTALGDPQTLVNKAVEKILCSYVDRDGKTCDRSSYRAIPYLQYVAENCVTSAIRAQMEKAIKDNQQAFEDELKKALSNPRIRKDITGRFVEAMLNAASNSWKMPVTVSFEVPKEY